MSLRLGRHALSVPLLSLVAACGAPTAGVPCGGPSQSAAVDRAGGMRLSGGQEALPAGTATLASQVRFSGPSQGVLVLTETLAPGSASALRVRRCPALLETRAEGAGVALAGLWASRGCVFPSDAVLAAEKVASLEAHVELPSGQEAPHRIALTMPGLSRGLLEPRDLPAGLVREEWFAVARGGKRKNLRTCGDMLGPSPAELPPPEGGKLFCYSLDEMSSFEATLVGTPTADAGAALQSSLRATREARSRAFAAMDAETAVAFGQWLASSSLEEAAQRALVSLAERIHPITCSDKGAADPALCTVAAELRVALAATFPAAALADYNSVLGAKNKSALEGAVTSALSKHQVDVVGGKKPNLVADVYRSLFRAYDEEWDEWSANTAPSFASEAGVSFTNAKVTPQGGVRGAVLVAIAPAAVERVFNPADGGWLLTLGGGLPLATVLSLKGDGGTEGTSGGVPLRPLPVAKPENEGPVTNGSSDSGKAPGGKGEVGSGGGSTPVGVPGPGPKGAEPATKGQGNGDGSAEEPRPSGRTQASNDAPKQGTAGDAPAPTCLVR